MEEDSLAVDSVLGVDLEMADAATEVPVLKRKRINNLNESHFLQAKGLPYLRKKCAKSIRPRINHKDEYKNLTNILSFYQLWGHSIYPKANFSDFLNMSMKIGAQSRQVKFMREGFIKEDMDKERESLAVHLPGGNSYIDNENENENENVDQDNANDDEEDEEAVIRTTQKKRGNKMFVAEDEDDEEDDLYSVPAKPVDQSNSAEPTDRSAAPISATPAIKTKTQDKSAPSDDSGDDFDNDDELDQLLTSTNPNPNPSNDIPDDDDIYNNLENPTQKQPNSNPESYEDYDEQFRDELEMLQEIGN